MLKHPLYKETILFNEIRASNILVCYVTVARKNIDIRYVIVRKENPPTKRQLETRTGCKTCIEQSQIISIVFCTQAINERNPTMLHDLTCVKL